MTPTRRNILASALAPLAARLAAQSPPRRIERWDRFELQLEGPRDGNPFLDVRLSAEFRQQHRTVQVDGFYDGGGVYKVRFSPDSEGEWTFVARSNRRELDGQTGGFVCVAPSAKNHGPVSRAQYLRFRLRRRHALLPFRHHLLRLDPSARRTPAADPRDAAHRRRSTRCACAFFPNGTPTTRTSRPCIRSRARKGRTTIRASSRVLPQSGKRIAQLQALGIEADLILFHPYDHWGYALMPPEVDDRYLRYVVARLAAFRNVWWSVANEWDLVKGKNNGRLGPLFPHPAGDAIRTAACAPSITAAPCTTPPNPGSPTSAFRVTISARFPSGFDLPQAAGLRRMQVRRQHSQALGRYLRAGNDAPFLARDG